MNPLKHQCSYSTDCGADEICQPDKDGFLRCVNPCQNLVCPDPNEVCESENGQARCKSLGLQVIYDNNINERHRASGVQN